MLITRGWLTDNCSDRNPWEVPSDHCSSYYNKNKHKHLIIAI